MAISEVMFHPTYGKRLRVEIEQCTAKSGSDWLEIHIFDERGIQVGDVCAFNADLKISDLVEAA